METAQAKSLIYGAAWLLCWALVTISAFGATADNVRELDSIKRKIDSERQGLSQLQVQEGKVAKSLNQVESELVRKSKDLKAAEERYATLTGELKKKQAEAARLDRSVAGRRELLARRAVALYRWQRQAQPVVLGSEPELAVHRQHKRYLEATLAYDQDLLRQLHAESERQRIMRVQLSQKQDEVSAHRKLLASARLAVGQEAEKKKLLLATLRQEKELRRRALRDMEAAAARLQRMLDDIARRAQRRPPEQTRAPVPPPPVVVEPSRGTLDWPVRGTVSAPFGRFKHPEFGTDIVRKGIEIAATPGESIRVVEAGRIAFADRFSGYGKLVIVDHGQRFFTIYGQLAEISRKRGELIKKGDSLGQVGDGQVYFEMRRDGQSVDPLPWFKK